MKKLLLTTVLAVATIVAMANPIGRTAAMQKAQDFMQGINPQAQLQAPATPRKAMGNQAQQPYYIFNAENNKGFVIVSGDDRSEEILGYSDEGHIDVDNMPEGLQYLLEMFTEELQALGDIGNAEAAAGTPARAPRKSMSTGRHAVAPMTTSIWTQGTPFNNKYPKYTGGANQGKTPPSGCGIIALSQMIYFHKYVNMRYDLPSYKIDTEFYQGTIPSLPKRTFDFSKLKDSYENGYTTAEADSISTFIKYVFTAMRGYFAKATSTQTPSAKIEERMSTYFNYEMTFTERSAIRPEEFEDHAYNDIRQGLPVMMFGSGPNWDHFFIADGYSYDNFFHFNFGWAGMCNGYYRLSPLNFYNYATPNAVGKKLRGYFGFRPKDGRPYEKYESVENMVGGIRRITFSDGTDDVIYNTKTITATRSADGTFNFNTYKGCVLLDNYTNLEGSERIFNTDFAVVDKDFNIISTFGAQNTTIPAKDYVTLYYDFKGISVPQGDGEYYFVHRSKANAATDGKFHISEVKASYCHYKAVGKNNKMTLTVVKTFDFDTSKTEIIGQCANNWHSVVRFYATNNTFNTMTRVYNLYVGSVADANFQDNKPLKLAGRASGYIELNFNPGETDNKLVLYDTDRAITDASYNYTVQTAVNRNLTCTWYMTNGVTSSTSTTNNTLYGNEVNGYITVKNNSTAEYNDMLTLSTYLGTSAYNGSSKSTAHLFPVSIPAGGTVKIDLSELDYSDLFDLYRDGLDYGLKLTLDLYSGKGDRADKITYKTYTITKGLLWWDDKGKLHGQASSNTLNFTVPENAVALSFQGAATPKSIRANSNPNTIYYVDSDSEVTLVKNGGAKNVVKGTSAVTDIVFNDNYAAFVPMSFHAGKVSYTRKFTHGFEGNEATRGWSTICLPFNVQKITNAAQNEEIDFFRNKDDKGKNFWLRMYKGHEFRTLYFDYPTAFEANVPYIISMPGQTYQTEGDKWCLTNKDIVFSAENTEVEKSYAIVDCDNYDFFGTSTATRFRFNEVKYLYSMEGNGNYFTYQNGTSGEYTGFKPFRGYMGSENVPATETEMQVNVVQLSPMDFYEAREYVKHRYPAVQFTYNGLTYEVPAWDEVAESGAVNTRLQAATSIKDGVTNVPAKTVTNRAWSVEPDPETGDMAFAAFEGGTGTITVGNASKSVSTLTYGETADLLGLSVATADRSVKVFDFASAGTTAVTVPGQYNVTQGVNAGHTFVVSEIGAGTYSSPTMTEVSIPATVTTIKDAAFNGCSMLNKVTFESEVPAAVVGDPFVGVTKNKCAVYVPAKMVKTYRESNDLWNEFIFASPVSATKKFVSFTSGVPFTTRQFNGKRWVDPVSVWMYWVDKAKNNTSASITMTATRDYETKVIPAGFGLVMKTSSTGGSGYIFMPPVGAVEKSDLIADNNLLKGVLVATQMKDIVDANPENNYYILTNNNFQRVISGNLAAGLAYLELPSNLGSAKVITLDDESTDGIKIIDADEQNAVSIYDIQGRKVETLSKGIYIKNGKKFVVK